MTSGLLKTMQMLATILIVTSLGCSTSPQALQEEMGSQTGNPPSVAKTGDHPESRVAFLMDAAIEAASRLHFAYDASRCPDGRLNVTAQWKNDPVVINFAFYQEADGGVNYSYMRECSGVVLAQQGDARILELFLATLDRVVNERLESLPEANQSRPTPGNGVSAGADAGRGIAPE